MLIRYLNANGEEYKKITYKNKVYDDFGNLLFEKKINVDCANLYHAIELFQELDFEEVIKVKYEVTVLGDGIREFAFQNVEGLGLLLEYESNKSVDNFNDKEIIKEKEFMLSEIVETGIHVDKEKNIKKAYELIKKKYL